MRRSHFLILLLSVGFSGICQSGEEFNDFLTVVLDKPGDSVETVIYYPPGTAFEVQDAGAEEVYPMESREGRATYQGPFKLIILG